ncbi:hypothetical protein STTU_1353 [Streptomyces sp. Tu6071]|nr:hypothetical protein STTU_1353 [Streptomyces sp. Tu6071]
MQSVAVEELRHGPACPRASTSHATKRDDRETARNHQENGADERRNTGLVGTEDLLSASPSPC